VDLNVNQLQSKFVKKEDFLVDLYKSIILAISVNKKYWKMIYSQTDILFFFPLGEDASCLNDQIGF